MEERDPPVGNEDAPSKQSQSAELAAAFRPGTYVVQVPKDQIYRVPPPENALIAERHRKPPVSKNKKRPCGSCCLCFCFWVVAVVLLLGLSVGIISVLLKPDDPTFYVERLAVKSNSPSRNQLHSHPEYDVTFRAKNPNAKIGILYKEGGVASLSFRQREIAVGKYPNFYQDNKNSKQFRIVFHGSNDIATLPTEIEQSMTSHYPKILVTFSVKMDIPARLRIGQLNSGSLTFVTACDVTVDTLAMDTRILSQKCRTKRRL